MEMETATNFLANSIVPDGVRAEEIKKSLAADMEEELADARQLSERIKQMRGTVPMSLALERTQTALQPPADTTDVIGVIEGVLTAATPADGSWCLFRSAQEDEALRVIAECPGSSARRPMINLPKRADQSPEDPTRFRQH